MTDSDSRDRWLDQQLDLRRQEVVATVRAAEASASATRLQKRTLVLQVTAVLAGLLASGAAAFAAYQAGAAVRASEQAAIEQSADSQLSTAISAIGGSTPAQRVAGMTLLDLNVHARIAAASSSLDRQDAFGEYVTALNVLANYIRDDGPGSGASPSPGTTAAAFGLGYGAPADGQSEPFDVIYAAAELRDLLSLRAQVQSLEPAGSVGIEPVRLRLRPR